MQRSVDENEVKWVRASALAPLYDEELADDAASGFCHSWLESECATGEGGASKGGGRS